MKKKKKYLYVYDRAIRKVVRCDTVERVYEIVHRDRPEYVVICEKCGCFQGVN